MPNLRLGFCKRFIVWCQLSEFLARLGLSLKKNSSSPIVGNLLNFFLTYLYAYYLLQEY